MPFTPFVVAVFYCTPMAPIAEFNPHILGAVETFVEAHPRTCFFEPQPGYLPPPPTGPATLEACNAQIFVRYGPGWQQGHEGLLFLGAKCAYAEPPDKVDMNAVKRRITE